MADHPGRLAHLVRLDQLSSRSLVQAPHRIRRLVHPQSEQGAGSEMFHPFLPVEVTRGRMAQSVLLHSQLILVRTAVSISTCACVVLRPDRQYDRSIFETVARVTIIQDVGQIQSHGM